MYLYAVFGARTVAWRRLPGRGGRRRGRGARRWRHHDRSFGRPGRRAPGTVRGEQRSRGICRSVSGRALLPEEVGHEEGQGHGAGGPLLVVDAAVLRRAAPRADSRNSVILLTSG